MYFLLVNLVILIFLYIITGVEQSTGQLRVIVAILVHLLFYIENTFIHFTRLSRTVATAQPHSTLTHILYMHINTRTAVLISNGTGERNTTAQLSCAARLRCRIWLHCTTEVGHRATGVPTELHCSTQDFIDSFSIVIVNCLCNHLI